MNRSCKLAAMASLAWLAAGAQAEAQLSRGENAILKRQLRGVESRAVTDPAGAARDLGNTRRDLVRDNRGVAYGPAGSRINRDLRGLASRSYGLVPGGGDVSDPQRFEPLPGTQSDRETLPSLTPPTRIIARLLDRAETGLAAGRAAQAASDLSTAEQGLAGLGPLEGARSLAARAERLRSRLPPSG